MPKTVTTDQAILDDLVRFAIKLTNPLSCPTFPREPELMARADKLREVHLHLFAMEFNALTAGLKPPPTRRGWLAPTGEDDQRSTRVAATLRLAARLIDAGTALVASRQDRADQKSRPARKGSIRGKFQLGKGGGHVFCSRTA
jgi:hypothetical protein